MSVVDASAVLAIINQEPERKKAAALVRGGTISPVNAAEVVQDLVKSGRTIDEAAQLLDGFRFVWSAPTREQAIRAAELRRPGLSLADRFCIALGEALAQPLVTKDSQWLTLPDVRTPIEFVG